MKANIDDLGRIRPVVRLLGFVASAPGFYRQAFVIHGASDFLIKALGDRGRHARSAGRRSFYFLAGDTTRKSVAGKLIRGGVTTNWKQALAQLSLAYPERINPHL